MSSQTMRVLNFSELAQVSGGMGAGHYGDSSAKANNAFQNDLDWLRGFATGFWAGL